MKFTALIVVMVFIAFDILTGWLKALYTGTFNSSVMRQGLFHKLGELLALGLGYACEYTFPLISLNVSVPFAGAIATYIVIMEVASIVENLAKLNPELAGILGKFFSKDKIQAEAEGGVHLEPENESTDST